MYGYWGKLLRVNLTNGEIGAEDVDGALLSSYLGAKGIGAYYLCKEMEKRAEPLSPDNLLILSTGPYQGTDVPATGRFALITKSPLTGIFLDTYCGGWFGHSLKRCGYDLLIIEGKAERPSYISIRDDEVQIKDASELWGRTTSETEDLMRRLEGEKVRVISTGPAGENLVRIACLVSDYRRSAGRGGSGAVFGSKNLKAVCVDGTKKVPVADGKRLKEVIRQIADNVKHEREEGYAFYKYGTSNAVDYASAKDRLP
ncbi:MAG: aldehyde ferredoxin oxidoreductase N-terminal domain-containing protein, partial [Thermoplasmata archaeon]